MCTRGIIIGVAVGLIAATTARAEEVASAPAATPIAQAETETTTQTTTTSEGNTTTTVETVQAAPPAAQAPAEKPIPLLDERTAYMVGRHTLKIGVLAFEFGILQRLSIGSDPPAWAVRAFANVLVPNLHLKFQMLDEGPVALALLVAGYYGNITAERFSSGHLLDVPVSLFASVKVHPRVYLHGEGAYIYARVFGAGDVTRAELSGAAAVRAAQAGLMLQVRLTRIVSLTATGRYQVWTGGVPFSASSTIDAYTSATVSGQLTTAVEHPWEAIGGVAVLWKHFHMILGAGYGYYFIPGMQIPYWKRTFVPDASLAVVL